jgi:hypothetical protein
MSSGAAISVSRYGWLSLWISRQNIAWNGRTGAILGALTIACLSESREIKVGQMRLLSLQPSRSDLR